MISSDTPILGPPLAEAVVLRRRPQVLSWDRSDAWSQQRLIPYRQEVATAFAGVAATQGLSFRLECGLGPTSNLEAAGDLDNLLIPVADALGRGRLVAAWGSKDSGAISRLSVGPAQMLPRSTFSKWEHASAHTTSSAGSEAWKVAIAHQVAAARPLPPVGGAALLILFRVGPGRAWHNLWKPAIDSLGRILGPRQRRWHPRDGRITSLGLSVEIEASMGWEIDVDIWWQSRPWESSGLPPTSTAAMGLSE